MAKQTQSNLAPATGAAAMFALQNFLRDDLGFVIARSGDGIAAFDATGTSVITTGGSGANGMANADAWFVAEDSAGEYSWLFQRNASDISWEVQYSAEAGFTGGSATVKATATDQVQLLDGTLFLSNNTYRWHLEGNDAPISGVYRWTATATVNGTGLPRTLVGHEALAVGSYPTLVGTRAAPTTGEADPSIQFAKLNGSGTNFEISGNADGWQNDTSSPVRAWYCYGGTNGQTPAYDEFQACGYNSSVASADFQYPADAAGNDGVGPDPRDGSDPCIPIVLGRNARLAVNVGPKGITSTLLIKGTDRLYPDTIDISGERFVYMGDLLIPFENGGTPLV